MDAIRSPQNPKIKLARSLHQRKGRRKHHAFLVEGLRHVAAALEAEAPLRYLLWAPERLTSPFGQELIRQAQARGIPVDAVTARVLDTISTKEHTQGLVAVAQPRSTDLADLDPAHTAWVVAAVAPQNPGNVGTLLRTMDAVGANALVLLDGGADPYHPVAVRASMGALFWLPVVQTSWSTFRQWQQAHGYRLYGTSAHQGTAYRAATYRWPLVLLLGNERHGLTAAQRAACDEMLTLPMHGHGTSLNLAVAAGVLLYAQEAQRHA